jgi:rubrerythrin
MQKTFHKKKGGDQPVNPELSQRRVFLQRAGVATASAALFLTGCKSELSQLSDDVAADTRSARRHSTMIDLGTGDIGVLNYAYLLEQLEAAFYIKAVGTRSFMADLTSTDRRFFEDIRDHEIVHREFFKAALGSAAIQDVEFDFSMIDFSDRNKVLDTAKTFEDLGVAAYNGAGKLLETPAYLLLAGKIVSVEARHAAYLREILGSYFPSKYNSRALFAGDDIIDENGLDLALPPSEVLKAAAPFVMADVTFNVPV